MSVHQVELQELKRNVNLFAHFRPLKKRGNGYSASCPIPGHKNGDRKPSLEIDYKDGAWVWTCRVHGGGGTIVDLVMKLKDCDEGAAIRELKQLGNIIPLDVRKMDEPTEKKSFAMTEDDLRKAEAMLADDLFAQEYLHQRGLSETTWKELHFGYTDSHRFGDCEPACPECGQHSAIVIPWIVDGKIRAVKYRNLTQTGKDHRYTSKGSTKGLLYGAELPAIGKHKDCVILVEGEADAALLRSLGFNAVTFGSTSGVNDALKPALERLKTNYPLWITLGDFTADGVQAINKVRQLAIPGAAEVKFTEDESRAEKDVGELHSKHGSDWLVEFLENTIRAARLAQESEVYLRLVRRLKQLEVEEKKRFGLLASSGVLTTITADSVEMKLTRWLWRNRVPLGALTVFFGMPDTGKSSVAIDVVSRITRGVRFPDSTAEPAAPGDVLMFVAEDDKATTAVPRLVVAGADLSRVHFATFVERNGRRNDFELDRDIDTLRATLESNPNIRLLVFDPLASYLGNVKKNAESDMRKLLLGLRNLAEHTGVAVIAIDHFNKNSDQAALHRLSGSQSLGAAPRAVWGFVRDPEDETKRIMMHAKLNLVSDQDKSNILYSSKSIPLQIEGQESHMPAIEWGETTKRQLDDVLRSDVSEGQLERAKKTLLAQLEKDGPTLSDESDEKLTAAGFSDVTIRRARSALGNEEKIAHRKQQGKGGRFLRFIPSQLDRAEGMLRGQKA